VQARRRNQVPCRSRAALLWSFAAFAILQLGLALAIELRLPELRDPEYGNRVTRLLRRTSVSSEKPLTVVMLGSSRTTKGFHAPRLEAYLHSNLNQRAIVFNFGITGAGPLMQLLNLRRLLERGIRPDLLLIEIFPPLLSGHAPSAELARVAPTRLWLCELPLLEDYGSRAAVLQAEWWRAWPLPWYVRRFAILSRLVPSFIPYAARADWIHRIDECGWIASGKRPTTSDTRRTLAERTKLEYQDWLTRFRLEGVPRRALHELLALCRKEKIAVGLVVMPETSIFRACYPDNTWLDIEAFINQLSRQYSAPVTNAREWIDDEHFMDGHHLSETGATEFTERLGRELAAAVDNAPWSHARLWMKRKFTYGERQGLSPP
jgi:hypothetical protein